MTHKVFHYAKKITVKNYKCFNNLTFDLTAADYSFNKEIVK